VSPPRKSVIWSPEARDQLRSIELEAARRILQALDDYLTDGVGDVKKLRPPRSELRFRVGDYRVFFYQLSPKSIRVTGVKHRSEAYR